MEKCAQCGEKYPSQEMFSIPRINVKACMPCHVTFHRKLSFAEALQLIARHTAAWARTA